MEAVKHEVATLEGALLDAAASKADGCADGVVLPYSTDWDWAGRILENLKIDIDHVVGRAPAKAWRALADGIKRQGVFNRVAMHGPTPQIAIARAGVASKFGEEVELP